MPASRERELKSLRFLSYSRLTHALAVEDVLAALPATGLTLATLRPAAAAIVAAPATSLLHANMLKELMDGLALRSVVRSVATSRRSTCIVLTPLFRTKPRLIEWCSNSRSRGWWPHEPSHGGRGAGGEQRRGNDTGGNARAWELRGASHATRTARQCEHCKTMKPLRTQQSKKDRRFSLLQNASTLCAAAPPPRKKVDADAGTAPAPPYAPGPSDAPFSEMIMW